MAPRKTTAPVPVDLDLDALEREATETLSPFTFRLHGHVFTLATGEDSDFRVLDSLNRNELTEAIRLLLGEPQYEKFVSKPVSMKTLKTVLEGWSKHKGLSLGE